MRIGASQLLVVAFALGPTLAGAGLVSHRQQQNTIFLTATEGAAELEWISASSFRYVRYWNAARQGKPITRERIPISVASRSGGLRIQSDELVVEIGKSDLRLRVQTLEGKKLAEEAGEAKRSGGGVRAEWLSASEERFYGLGPATRPGLDRRGETVRTRRPFLISSAGYGQYYTPSGEHEFDLAASDPERRRVVSPGDRTEFFFYYGPTPKDILEEHLRIVEPEEFDAAHLELLREGGLPKEAVRMPSNAGNWDALAGAVRALLHASLTAIHLPALDLDPYASASAELAARAAQLAAIVPIVYRTGSGNLPDGVAGLRHRLGPYLLTYMDEAKDRGFPPIRPLLMQFSRETQPPGHDDVFMLGDELLVAPILSPGGSRRVYLPMGIWTELSTNATHPGRRTIDVSAPADSLPMFARNGSIVPFAPAAEQGPMELHYFPRLGGEFFLYERYTGETTQFHAAPAGEFMRLEIETKADRDYEWVVHHLDPVVEVNSAGAPYARVNGRAALQDQSWFYDAASKSLHVRVWAKADTDIIVNIRFDRRTGE